MIDLLGGLPSGNDLQELKMIYNTTVAYARDRNKKKKKNMEGKDVREYFGNNTIVALCLSICCKCKALDIPGCLIQVPFSFVGALSYHKDFDKDSKVTSFAVSNRYLRNEIAKSTDLQRILRGYGRSPQYGNNAFCANERQLDAMHIYLHTPPSAVVRREWRPVRVWDIRADHVDRFEQEEPDVSELLALIRMIKWNKKK